jgi:spore germination cell wall hydrolase CwlJ-like protein|tara:strand:+ start:959 stop:1474 length:516 start_codon:yes stop_codon:yes gene_type:complete
MINVNELILTGFVFITPVQAEQVKYDTPSVICLAHNMYFEARGQGSAGLLAVSSVVLNRVKDSRFPNTICEVIKQGPTRESWQKDGTFIPVRHKCQFSWYCDGKSDVPKDKKTYNRLLEIAKSLVYDKLPFIDITDGALFYHADYVNPDWAKTKTKTVEIQDHIFYKWDKK